MRALDTDRLHLRPLGADDEALYCRIYTDPDLMRYVAPPMSIEAARHAFLKTCQRNEEADFRYRLWVIAEKQRGSDIGVLGLIRNSDTAEIGAMLLDGSQGKGFAAESITALVGHAFSTHDDLTLLYTRHRPDHVHATGLMEKLGFLRATPDTQDDPRCCWHLPRSHWDAAMAAPEQPLRRLTGPTSIVASWGGVDMETSGNLACVGLGMMLGAHISPRSRSHIEQADVVFGAVSDPLVELWLQDMHADVRSLQPYYGEGKSRHDTYREMVEAMLVEVRAGRKVCGVFYGHPGVFALVPHRAIELARLEGFEAHMEPGISAEDCLYADLGIDPGKFGCQHYEASQFMFYQRRIDPSAVLVLWQVGIAGDRSIRRFATEPEYRRLLVELLAQDYPLDHEVIVYEAATLPITTPRMERIPLSALADTPLNLQSTLVVPPAMPMQRNLAMLDRIAQLDDARA